MSTAARERLSGTRVRRPDDLLVALSSYSPGAGQSGLLDQRALRGVAADVLHDLGNHDHCVHDVPIRDRPQRS